MVRISYPGWAGFVAILLAFTKKNKDGTWKCLLGEAKSIYTPPVLGFHVNFRECSMWFQVRNHGRRMSLWSLQLGEIFTAKKTRWNSMEFLVCGWKYCEQNEMLSRCGSKMVCGFKAGFVLSFLKCLFHNVISEWAVCCWPLETYRFCRKARKRHSGKPHLGLSVILV